MPKRANVGNVKTPQERGPFATWVVEVRNALDLTSEWVAAETGYDDATIRKLEGGAVTRPQRRKVTALLERVAAEKGMRIPPAPTEAVAEPPGDLPAAIRDQTAAMLELVAELREVREAQQGRDEGLAVALGELASTLERLRLVPVGASRTNNG